MQVVLERVDENPYIYTKDNIIYKVSDGFLNLTGYNKCDLLGNSLMHLGLLLKSNYQISIQDIKDSTNFYIFNSDNLPLEIKVSFERVENADDKIYYFTEKKDSALQFTLDNFGGTGTSKNGSVAIFSYPDCILLKHDENYIQTLVLMDRISVNPLGKNPLFSENITDLFKQGISLHEFGVESTSLDGIETYWDINIKMIAGNRNNKYLVSSFYDVTDRAYERKLSIRQRSEMELIVDNLSDVINIIDKNGKYTFINKVGREVLSPYIPEYIPDINSLNSKMVYDTFRINDSRGNELPFETIPEQRVLRGEKLTNHMIIGTSELPTSYYVCDATPIYDEKGNIDGGILVYKNLENEYKAEEYKALKENIEDISIYYASFSHKDFKINYINEYAFNIFKEELADVNTELDVIGQNFFNFYRAENVEELIKDINKSIEKKSSYLHKLEFIKNGEIEFTKTIFQPIFNKNNEIEKIIALGLDISDEEIAKKNMEELLKAQEELFINTSHELKTPLSVIFSGSQLLNLYLEEDSLEEFRDNIVNVNKMTIVNCYRLIKLINNILEISKIESGLDQLKLGNYNIVGIVDDIVQSVSEYTKSNGLKILFDPDMEELMISLDVDKFDRILLNLISNAIKFSITSEIVLIKLVKTDTNTVRISVTDEGIGIDPKNLDVIFQKFIQLNRNLNRIAEGTGLGLSIARSMAELHGGSLSVESRLGKGSTFTIELPIKTIDNQNSTQEYQTIDRVELIKYEFSDIYL